MSTDQRIVLFDRLGGPEVLRLARAPLREPAAGEVRIRVLAIGVTQGDAMFRSGTYLEKPSFPSGLGTEACGIVEAVGEGVRAFRLGDRVSSISSFSVPQYPLYGDHAVLPVTALFHTPAAFTDEEGSAWTLAYMPMYFALFREVRLKVGEWLLLNAAGATTSLAALQWARMAGARVVGLVRHADKVAALDGLGYDAVLPWGPDTLGQVRDITGGGAHVVLDPVLGEQAAPLFEMTRHRGRVLIYGALGSGAAQASIYPMAMKAITLTGFTIYNYTGSTVNKMPRDEGALVEASEAITVGAASGHLKPKIALRFPLDQVVAAHQASAAGKHVGKVLLIP
jgi:NADPH:quinone reductase